MTPRPAIIGTPGAGLTEAPWAVSGAIAAAGLDGERRTGQALHPLASVTGPTVLHDLRIPRRATRANIDHVVVAGRSVWLIDSKSWRPGFVWTLGSRAYRGLTPFPPATKQTMPMARDAVTEHLTARGHARFEVACLVVVWPSAPGKVRTWALDFPGAETITGAAFTRRAGRMIGRRRADPGLVEDLAGLVNHPAGPVDRLAG